MISGSVTVTGPPAAICFLKSGMTETPNKLIHIGHPIDVDEDRLYYALRVMKEAAANETDDMRLLMQSIVSTYHIKTEENQQCENLQKAI